jgi:hypothetical protein
MLDYRIRQLVSGCFQFTLPHYKDTPAHGFEGRQVSTVSFSVLIDLLTPEVPVVCWPLEESAFMSVPKATMYEHDDFARRKNKVRSPGQTGTTKAIAEALRMQSPTDK